MTSPGNPFGAPPAPSSNPFTVSATTSSNPFAESSVPPTNPWAMPSSADTIAPAAPVEDSSSSVALGMNPFSGRPVAPREEDESADAPHGAGGPSRGTAEEAESFMARLNPFGIAKATATAPSVELLEHPYLKFLINPASITEPNKIESYLVDGSRPYVIDPLVKVNGVIAAPFFGKDPMSAIVRECSAPFNPFVPSSSTIQLLVETTAAEHAGKPVAEQIRAFEKVVRQVYRTPLSNDVKGLVEVALRRAFTLKLIDGEKQLNRAVTYALRAHRPGLTDAERFKPDFFANIELMHGFSTRMGTFASDLDPTYELTRDLVAAKVSNIEVNNRLFDLQGHLGAAGTEIQETMQMGIQDILRNIPNPTHKAFLQGDITALIKWKVMENAAAKAVTTVAATMYDVRRQQTQAFGGRENPNSLVSLLLAIDRFTSGEAPQVLVDVVSKVFATRSSAGTIFSPEQQGTILTITLNKPGVNGTIVEAVFQQYLSSVSS